jgi:hypothetical protein
VAASFSSHHSVFEKNNLKVAKVELCRSNSKYFLPYIEAGSAAFLLYLPFGYTSINRILWDTITTPLQKPTL